MAADLGRRFARAAHRRSGSVRFQLAALSVAANRLAGGPAPIRVLLISDGLVYTSEQQFAPFARHAAPLRRRLGMAVRFMSAERAQRLSKRQLAHYDLIGLKFSFRADREWSAALARYIRQAIDGTASRLFYFDGDDDLNVQRQDLLALSDRYVKKHTYRDRREYGVARIGKSNLTDHVARVHGRSFADNEIPDTPPLDPALVERIVTGWSIGLDDKMAALAARLPAPSDAPRANDVCSRAITAPESWIYPLRDPVAQTLETMASEFRVLVPRNRVSQDEYYSEMLSSTICVSPFGYGEICWRDFEAILCGCLLVKPDMGHVETAPDIFVPGETYVPVRWDYADLPDVCARYLRDDTARRRIVDRAREVVLDSLTADWFVSRVRQLID